jgi:hypothetical protein
MPIIEHSDDGIRTTKAAVMVSEYFLMSQQRTGDMGIVKEQLATLQ